MTITIPASRFGEFRFNSTLGTRWGQQFYDFMALHKVVNQEDKIWCDRLYEQGTEEGIQMVVEALDHDN